MWGDPHFAFYGRRMNEDVLKESIRHTIEQQGALCVDITFRGSRAKRIVEVFADSESGVSADDLARMSRALHPILDAAFQAASDYMLVVSSPGLDQPLQHPWQYRRHAGRTARMRVHGEPLPRELVGVIEHADEVAVDIRTRTGIEHVLFTDILETIIQPSLK